MAGSYDRRLPRVRAGLAGLALPAVWLALAGSPAAAAQPPDPSRSADTVLLQLRVFDGMDDVTRETRIFLYPRGRRTGEIPVTLSPDAAYEAQVPPGFYDVQAIHERRGQVAGIRWVEQVLVQRYPDEYGRHLQVLNLNGAYGALQIRPAPSEEATARGWSAVAHQPGDTTREVTKARQIGSDLLVVVPAGRYDIRVNLNDRTTSWIRDVEIPIDRTRLKTWTAAGAVP